MYVSMKGMLERANQGNYAVMAINCLKIVSTRSCIEASQSLRAPIIINIVQEHMVNHCDSDLIAPIVKKLANRASVEVALFFVFFIEGVARCIFQCNGRCFQI